MRSCLDEMERRRQRKGTGDDGDAEQGEGEGERGGWKCTVKLVCIVTPSIIDYCCLFTSAVV